MIRFFSILLICAIPALAALGHDYYLAYGESELTAEGQFFFSDLGWIWVTYWPESHEQALKSLPPSIWMGFVDPLLRTPAIWVSLGFGGVLAALLMLVTSGGKDDEEPAKKEKKKSAPKKTKGKKKKEKKKKKAA